MLTTKGKQLFEDLREKKVNPALLAVVNIGGGEQVIGEVNDGVSLVGEHSIIVTNPKRFARIQQMTQQGLSIQFIIGDLDLVESGRIHLRPVMGYRLSELGPESIEGMLTMYLDFIKRKILHSAQAAGLVVEPPFVRAPR